MLVRRFMLWVGAVSAAERAEGVGADFSSRTTIERFGFAPALRSALVEATARALSAFVTSRCWLSAERAERVTRDARESANIMISTESARSRLCRRL
jgi:hypothetical protein